MNDNHPFGPDDLDPSVDASERAELAEVAGWLIRGRPAPRAGFRAELRVHLREMAARRSWGTRPRWLWQRVVTLAICGGGLLGLVGLGIGGAGPFAP